MCRYIPPRARILGLAVLYIGLIAGNALGQRASRPAPVENTYECILGALQASGLDQLSQIRNLTRRLAKHDPIAADRVSRLTQGIIEAKAQGLLPGINLGLFMEERVPDFVRNALKYVWDHQDWDGATKLRNWEALVSIYKRVNPWLDAYSFRGSDGSYLSFGPRGFLLVFQPDGKVFKGGIDTDLMAWPKDKPVDVDYGRVREITQSYFAPR